MNTLWAPTQVGTIKAYNQITGSNFTNMLLYETSFLLSISAVLTPTSSIADSRVAVLGIWIETLQEKMQCSSCITHVLPVIHPV